MKALLSLEYLGGLVLSIFLFMQLDYAWWVFPAFILAPDISMLGYLINTKVGAFTYNFAHHLGVAVLMYILGVLAHWPIIELTGTILLGHVFFDRLMGYGLKYADNFKHTHLGTLG